MMHTNPTYFQRLSEHILSVHVFRFNAIHSMGTDFGNIHCIKLNWIESYLRREMGKFIIPNFFENLNDECEFSYFWCWPKWRFKSNGTAFTSGTPIHVNWMCVCVGRRTRTTTSRAKERTSAQTKQIAESIGCCETNIVTDRAYSPRHRRMYKVNTAFIHCVFLVCKPRTSFSLLREFFTCNFRFSIFVFLSPSLSVYVCVCVSCAKWFSIK